MTHKNQVFFHFFLLFEFVKPKQGFSDDNLAKMGNFRDDIY